MQENTSALGGAHRWVGRALVVYVLALVACGRDAGDRKVFELLSPTRTGVDFANTITTSDSLNVQTDVYVYNGAGVAVGDIDNDGLPDIFFSGNMVSSRLYRNKGDMLFEDITAPAGVTTRRWATGATMVDINGDGYLDIYVSVSGPEWSRGADRANLLFVNNRNRTFTEAAAQYGVADSGFTTHAVFLDYDRDGCLDLFLLNNSPKDFVRGVSNNPMGTRGNTPGSYNELYHNDCKAGTAPRFTNVSQRAGILRDAGYGLGVVVADLNRDGWPDIYVSNDGTPNDVIYVNNGNGTFTNKAGSWLKHGSEAGMGVDISDFNNDGWPDILQVDMMPRDLDRRKRTSGAQTYGGKLDARSRGFRDDFSQNALQLSNGITRDGDVIFSEVARLGGVAHTDWSWSALFADFDNDGFKDIFIGNGYPKAVNDLDYMNASLSAQQRGDVRRARALLKDLPTYEETSYLFRNNGDLTFTDKSDAWGIRSRAYSYGAAYADLNNDGRLDLVVNNIDAAAFVYENVGRGDDSHHYLEIKLLGEGPRSLTAGIGAELTVTVSGKKQYAYATPYRGFMSSMDDRVHFGLGAAKRVDTLEVGWPDGRRQVLTNVAADTLLTVKESDAGTPAESSLSDSGGRAQAQWFTAAKIKGLKYSESASTQLDYAIQPLLPYMISNHGPVLAVADVDGDNLDDVFIGGSAGVAGRLFLQRSDGSFSESVQGQPWEPDKAYDDWGAVFFDANGDGKPDLYVASGGYRLAPSSPMLQDRLYINRGAGVFSRDSSALPPMMTSTAAVRVGDFNGDGRPDLFVGGRLTPRSYPSPARSYVLRNDGGHFTDVTEQFAPDLAKPVGMITDAAWIDFDGDGRLDLVTVGEWMPIQFYRNDGKRFIDVTASTSLPPTRGWWYSLATADFNGDGRPDLVVGNLGLNHSYTTSSDNRFGVYAGSFAGSNQTNDLVFTQEVKGTEYPLAGLAQLGQAIYQLGIRYPTNGSFARAKVQEVFGPALERATHYQTDTFASVSLRNDGGGKFALSPLPSLAQIAPIRGIVADDVDGDGHLDVIVAGNIYDFEPNTPRADAGNGLWLRGDGKGHFSAIPPAESGLVAPLDVAGLAIVRTAAGKMLLVANAGDSLQTFAIRKH